MAPPHVVVIAFPFSSHPVMLFRLARALAAAAPAATFAFLSTSTSLARLQNADALQDNLRFVEVPDGSPPKGVPRDVAVEHFMAAAEAGGLLEAARASTGGARVSCVVADAFVWMAAEAAAAMAAPLAPVWTCGPSALLAHLRADALRGDKAATSRPDDLLTTYPGLGSYRVRDLPEGIVSGDPDHPFLRLFRRIEQHLPVGSTTAFALNACSGLVPQDVMAALAAQLPNCLSVGPFYLLPGTDSPDTDNAPADSYGCLAWLDGHAARTVAYVSFGTIATAPPEELCELAAGMEATGAPFMWSLPEDLWPQLPPGFMERSAGTGFVVPWAPQVQVLRHASVGAFVTHAGWSSVLESVSSGVPMACRPFFTDQRMNARLVDLRGFGAMLEEPVTRRGVAAVVASLLSSGEGARLRARMQEVRTMAATAFAPGGGSRDNFDKLVNIVCAL